MLASQFSETQRDGLARTDRLRLPRHRRHSLTGSAQPEQSTNDPAATHRVEEVGLDRHFVNIGWPTVDHPVLDPGGVELGHQTVEQH